MIANNPQNQNHNQIKETINNIGTDEEELRKKCLKKLNKLLSKDDLTDEDIQKINALKELLMCCNEKKEMFSYTNTKEDAILLKNLFVGTENFEDWLLFRLFTRAKLVVYLLNNNNKE